MKLKRTLITISIIAVLLLIPLISMKSYYVAIALVVGALIFGHREFWSLITKRKLPPFDERVQNNINKAVRNGFIFFILATALLMLPFSTVIANQLKIVHILGGIMLTGGVVYLLSYVFYDRVEPALNARWLKMFKIFLLTVGISVATFIISFFLHNAIYALLIQLFGADFWESIGMPDEPVFFFIAVILSPLGLLVGFIGSLIIFIKGLFTRVSTG